ncbi:MAG: universal stress protein [Myxococcota bacterium]|nr:universal stress protein [Myxococcota bacterium]
MSKLQHVLCAVDFSPTSIGALDYATLLARKDDAALHVVHVCPLLIAPYSEGGALVPGHVEAQIQASAERSLREVLEAHRDAAVVAESHVAVGAPADAIVRDCEHLCCDLVVVGTTGKTGLTRLLIGSVAERVLRTSPVDVLAVPTAVAHAPAKRIRSIVVAVDFSAPAEVAFLSALALARKHDATLHVVHAWEPAAYSVQGSELALSYDREIARDLEALVHRHPVAGITVSRHVRRGVPYVEIAALAGELGADLVVVGTTGRTGLEHFLLGSVAERVVRASSVPVLTVRRREGARAPC